ncbi:uncharacterized protein LOC110885479 [Helianthus annuus]|uniref:uncharacterized protein LOC110885479 n=1 Tax=Helianthus annuus TaxID=4232 RepID=UPI001652C059|nr:uncharacterized protein LOC110885479 [Helianthus annuus]XP_035834378.1 uncharacterized protein LOC110885479 [Helianthus annuus]XP_035834379.1 uncharacterized protein LOC110885479 [Helianthus annuus]
MRESQHLLMKKPLNLHTSLINAATTTCMRDSFKIHVIWIGLMKSNRCHNNNFDSQLIRFGTHVKQEAQQHVRFSCFFLAIAVKEKDPTVVECCSYRKPRFLEEERERWRKRWWR